MRTKVLGFALIAMLAIAQPALAQTFRSLRAQNELATLVINAEETQAAERRQANRELLRQRQVIGARDASIRELERALRGANAGNRTLEKQLEDLRKEAVDDKNTYTRQLAERDATYARERQLLIESGEQLLETEQGLEALHLFNTGDRSDWERAKLVLSELNSMRERARAEVNAAQTVADRRATAQLYAEKHARGEETAEATLEQWKRVTEIEPNDSQIWIRISILFASQGNSEAAAQAVGKAVSTAKSDQELSFAYHQRGFVQQDQFLPAEALISFQEALRLRRNLAINGGIDAKADLANTLNAMARLLTKEGRPDEAYPYAQEATGIRVTLLESLPNNVFTHRDLASSYDTVGKILTQLNNTREAEKYYRLSLTYSENVYEDDPSITNDAWVLTEALISLGDNLRYQSRFEEAESLYDRALALRRQLTELDPLSAPNLDGLAVAIERKGDMRGRRDDHDGALALFDEHQEIAERVMKISPESTEGPSLLAFSYSKKAEIYARARRLEEAVAAYTEAVNLRQGILLKNPHSFEAKADLGISYSVRGRIFFELGDTARSFEDYSRSYEIRRNLVEIAPNSIQVQREYAIILVRLSEVRPDLFPLRLAYDQFTKMERAGLLEQRDFATFQYIRELVAEQD
jgi:tetratricopeptide (TPR) repeat protein